MSRSGPNQSWVLLGALSSIAGAPSISPFFQFCPSRGMLTDFFRNSYGRMSLGLRVGEWRYKHTR